MVPESPGKHATVHIYDHANGGCEEKSLLAARAARDELCASMPYPITAMLRQYRDGTYATQMRLNAEKETGAVWTAEYLRLDQSTLRPRAAVVSRSVSTYGSDEARALVEAVWNAKVLEQAAIVDRLVRAGVPILHHGASSGQSKGRGSRYRVHSSLVEDIASGQPHRAKPPAVVASEADARRAKALQELTSGMERWSRPIAGINAVG